MGRTVIWNYGQYLISDGRVKGGGDYLPHLFPIDIPLSEEFFFI